MRGGRQVFAGLSFALAPRDALVLRGPNGSGKSSLLRLLAGFLRAGRRPARLGRRRDRRRPRRRIARGCTTSATPTRIKGLLTVRENLAFAAALARRAARAASTAALAGFDLGRSPTLPARYLSAGQRGAWRSPACSPARRPLWLLDEPEVGLDAANRARLEQALAAHRAGGGIAVLATHGDVAVADALRARSSAP